LTLLIDNLSLQKVQIRIRALGGKEQKGQGSLYLRLSSGFLMTLPFQFYCISLTAVSVYRVF